MSHKQVRSKPKYQDDEDANLDYANFDKIDDRQYDSLLPKTNGKTNPLSYFKSSNKYAGKVAKQEDQSDDNEVDNQNEDGDEDEDEDVKEADGIKQALNQIRSNRKQRSNLLSEDLRLIDREDKQNLIKMKQEQDQEGSSKALQNQLTEFGKLAQIRYYSQKNIEQLKKFPTNNFPASNSLHLLHKQAEKASLNNLQKLVENYEKLSTQFFKSEYKLNKYNDILANKNENMKDNRLNVQKLWQMFEQQTEDINSKVEQEIINWSHRTTLLRNSTNKSQINSLLMQTPVGQAKKAVSDWQKVSKKCQQKRSPFRILFEPEQNLRETTDKRIYDDIDLLQQVQKTYQQDLQKDDKDFLVNDTLKYLQNKNRTRIVKDVDRKASKNRKIRFNVHPKLLNFMPCQNQNLLEARDQIVKNLFNKGTMLDPVADFIDI